MKLADVKVDTYNDFDVQRNDKDPQFKVGDHLMISKYKNIFEKGYTPSYSGEGFPVKDFINTVPWTHVIEDQESSKEQSNKV